MCIINIHLLLVSNFAKKFHWVKLVISLEINNIPHLTTVGYVKLENKEVEFTAFLRIIIVTISKQRC